ncbi:MAG: hypothetical protein Q9214_006061 [Letrouitia sp. 1 TL-2023]
MIPTHPSLPLAASTHRNILRNLLKKYKRSSPASQISSLKSILSALTDYIPYLFAVEAGLSGQALNGEEIDVILEREIEMEWRTTLAARTAHREAPRIKSKGLDFEVCFTLNTLANVCSLLARTQIHGLHASTLPSAQQRLSIINTAKNYLLQANSIHLYLMSRFSEPALIVTAVEMVSSLQGGLAALAVAEATLLAVLTDDPYPTVVAQDRNKNDKEWMIKPPDIPKVRAHLFARLCLAAGEHAGKAGAMLDSNRSGSIGRVDNDIVRYASDLRKTARAKACRFFGIDMELGGETGKAIAWLQGAEEELGFASGTAEGSFSKGISKLKKDFAEKREDKKIEKSGDWGNDAGRFEEGRVIEMLEKKWNKINDTVPSFEPLLASMPLGRDVHQTKVYEPPTLDADILERMRAPPNEDGANSPFENDSSGDEAPSRNNSYLPGAFPSSSMDSSHGGDYY